MVWYVRRLVQLAVVLAALVQFAGFLQAVHPFFDSIAHFRLQITFLLVLGIAVLVVLGSLRVAVVALVIAGAGVFGMAPALGSIGSAPDSKARRLVVVQFNMLYRNTTPTKLAQQVRTLKADAVTLEEVSDSNKALLTELAADYPYQSLCTSFSVGSVAVLSRWPALEKGCSQGKGLAWLRVDVDGMPVTFASLHLHWPFPFEQDEQITDLEAQFRGLPKPVILGGDFNAAPWSHAVDRVAEATNTHVAAGLRLSYKFGKLGLGPWPFLPIDHVLLPARARAVDIHVGRDAGSDHLPVIATIDLTP